MLFGLYDARRGVPQVLNPSILIAWTQLKVVALRMLSAGQHLALSRQNLSIITPQIAVSEEPRQPVIASDLLCFAAPEDLDSCLNISNPF